MEFNSIYIGTLNGSKSNLEYFWKNVLALLAIFMWLIVHEMNNFSVVIVTGYRRVELLSNNGSWLCDLPIQGSIRDTGHSQTGTLSCGGGTCVTFSGGLWKQTHLLSHLRDAYRGHTSWASPRGVLLMGGLQFGRTTKFLNGTTTPLLENKRNWNLFNDRG